MTDDRYLYNDYAASTLFTTSVTSFQLTFEKENAILSDSPSNAWLSDGTGIQYFTFTGLSATNIKAAYLILTNLEPGDTVEIEGSNDGFSTTLNTASMTNYQISYDEFNREKNLVETVTTNHWYNHIDWTYRDYRFKFNTVRSISGYQIGKILLYAGDYTVDKNINVEFRGGVSIIKDEIQTEFGHIAVKPLYQRNTFDQVFTNVKGSQITEMQKISMGKNIVIWLDGFPTGKLYYGNIQFEVPENRHQILPESYDNSISGQFIEII